MIKAKHGKDTVRESRYPGGGAPAVFTDIACGVWDITAGIQQGSIGFTFFRALGTVSISVESDVPGQLTIEIPSLGKAVITVVSEDSQPVTGGAISAWNIQEVAGRSASSSFFTLSHKGYKVLLLQEGRYQLSYRPPASRKIIETMVDGSTIEGKPVIDIGDEARHIRYNVSSAVAIHGTVLEPDGQGVGGVILEPWNQEGHRLCVRCWSTDSAGRFTMEVAGLPTIVKPRNPEGSFSFEPSEIVVTTKTATQPLAFIALPDTGTKMTGTILGGKEQKPLRDVKVFSYPVCPEDADTMRGLADSLTDKNGKFEIPIDPRCGMYLRIETPKGSEFLGREWEGNSSDCSIDQKIVLSKGASVRGVLRDQWKHPLPGIGLKAGGSSTLTDQQGRFQLGGLGMGVHEIALQPSTNSSPEQGKVLVRATFADGTSPPVFEIKGTEPESTIELLLLDGGNVCLLVSNDDDLPISISRLRLYEPGSEDVRAVRRASRAKYRDDPANLCIGPVQPGEYFVLAGNDTGDFLPTWWPGEEERRFAIAVTVEAGKTNELGSMPVRPVGKALLTIGERVFSEDDPIAIRLQAAQQEESKSTADDGSVPIEWKPVPSSWIHLSDRLPDEESGGEQMYSRVRLSPVPVGRWMLQFCEGPKGCKGDKTWCSDGPVVVEQGKKTEVMLMYSPASSCPIPVDSDGAAKSIPD